MMTMTTGNTGMNDQRTSVRNGRCFLLLTLPLRGGCNLSFAMKLEKERMEKDESGIWIAWTQRSRQEYNDRSASWFGLFGFEKSMVMKLSGGERQKLSVVLSLLGKPEVVFLDELTTGCRCFP